MLQKSSIEKIMGVFCRFPTREHTLKDISTKAKIAHTSAKQILKKLATAGLIQKKIEHKGKRKFPLYEANKRSKVFIQYKKRDNIRSIMESGIIVYIEEKLMPACVVLFGSYQRGEDTEESDIDLFVESKQKEISLKQFEKKLGKKIELHFKEHFTSYPRELKNNIINGTILQGFLEGYA